ncbi:septation protein SepH [Modestobacter lapidis]
MFAHDGPDAPDPADRFLVPIDDRLRAAARGDAHRVAQIEIEVGNSLPPRVIQARIRAGETPEEVAAASGTSVERIMRFAHPVLQERIRVSEQARESRVRLSEGTPSVPLEQFMSDRLRLLGADLDAVRWDARRTEDGTWHVEAAWRAGHKSGTTLWSFDLPARTVTPVDAATTDFAEGTRLVRVVPDVPAGTPAADPRRPIAVVRSADPAAAGSDDDPTADHPATDALDEDGPGEPAEDVRVPATDADLLASEPSGADAEDDLATRDTVVLGRVDGETEDPRARIPAWEDIVFGVRRHR